jgi:DNA-binding NarL/FixJ family response regulator
MLIALKMTMKRQPKEEKTKIKILIVDDHPIVREGLAQLINKEEDLMVCGQAEDADMALAAIGTLKPDMIIIDLTLRGIDGIELIKTITARHARLPVLVFSIHDEALYAERALRAGARGYVMKREATEKVMLAIRRVLSGEIYVSEKMAKKLLHKYFDRRQTIRGSPIERLSDRELSVFRLIGQGLGTRQIAEQLHLSVKTIESHRAHIMEKLNLKSATELVQYAIQWGSLP